jgi:hypothetical protein
MRASTEGLDSEVQDGRDAQPIREGERHDYQEPGHARLSADESRLLPSRPS